MLQPGDWARGLRTHHLNVPTYYEMLPRSSDLDSLELHKQRKIDVKFLLSLAPQPSLGLGLLHKIRLNFLEASQQFSFFTG
jgi:hypothetical protein